MTWKAKLKRFAELALRFRNTPIVDDEFERRRDEFDACLRAMLGHVSQPSPKIVTLCGSTRFFAAFQAANYRETMAGNIVLSVGFYPHSPESLPTISQALARHYPSVAEGMAQPIRSHGETVGCDDEQKKALDRLHFRKIDLSDEVLVLNVGGYIGHSTRNEIDHAEATGVPVRYLEPVAAATA